MDPIIPVRHPRCTGLRDAEASRPSTHINVRRPQRLYYRKLFCYAKGGFEPLCEHSDTWGQRLDEPASNEDDVYWFAVHGSFECYVWVLVVE